MGKNSNDYSIDGAREFPGRYCVGSGQGKITATIEKSFRENEAFEIGPGGY